MKAITIAVRHRAMALLEVLAPGTNERWCHVACSSASGIGAVEFNPCGRVYCELSLKVERDWLDSLRH